MRWKIEDFLWRYWYKGNRALVVLAVILVVILAVVLLALARRLRVYQGMMGAGLIVGLVVVGWLLFKPLAPTPLLNSDEGPVVKNGVAAIVV